MLEEKILERKTKFKLIRLKGLIKKHCNVEFENNTSLLSPSGLSSTIEEHGKTIIFYIDVNKFPKHHYIYIRKRDGALTRKSWKFGVGDEKSLIEIINNRYSLFHLEEHIFLLLQSPKVFEIY